MDVHRHYRRARLLGELTDTRLEFLDTTVRRAASFREKDEVPARLQQLARAVQLGLRAACSGERKRVEEQADDVAEDGVLEPVIGGGRDHGAVSGLVRQRVEDERGVGVARVVGREDHRALQLPHPLPPLYLGVSHGFRERNQQDVLDEVADRSHGLDARPPEVARGRRYDRSLLGPRMWTRRVPVPWLAHAPDVGDWPPDPAGEAREWDLGIR